jgi:DNA-binding NarL/FixJ family response regulator
MVVASSPMLRAGLVSWLNGDEDMRVVAVVGTAGQCRDVEADVAVVGLAGLGLDAATRSVCRVRARSDIKLVAVVEGEDEVLGWVATAGVDACLNLGTVDTHELVDAVRGVMGGWTIMSTELLGELRRRERAMAPGWTLTPRERDVLALLAEGQSNKSIAFQLGLQVGTVRIYVSMILAKLGVANRTEAAAVTLRQDLLSSSARPADPDDEIARPASLSR